MLEVQVRGYLETDLPYCGRGGRHDGYTWEWLRRVESENGN
jgi:hypothetical protein